MKCSPKTKIRRFLDEWSLAEKWSQKKTRAFGKDDSVTRSLQRPGTRVIESQGKAEHEGRALIYCTVAWKQRSWLVGVERAGSGKKRWEKMVVLKLSVLGGWLWICFAGSCDLLGSRTSKKTHVLLSPFLSLLFFGAFLVA